MVQIITISSQDGHRAGHHTGCGSANRDALTPIAEAIQFRELDRGMG